MSRDFLMLGGAPPLSSSDEETQESKGAADDAGGEAPASPRGARQGDLGSQRAGARQDLIARLLEEREATLHASHEVEELSARLEEREQRTAAARAEREERQALERRDAVEAREAQRQQRARREQQERRRAGKPFSRKSLEQVKHQVETERSKDCTFKPKLTAYQADRSLRESGEQRLSRLAQPRSEYWARIEEQREAEELRQMTEVYTFKPDISLAQQPAEGERKSERGAAGGEASSEWQRRVREAYRNHVPVEKRLHLDASERWAARDRAKRELEDAEMDAQSYRPRVNDVSEELAAQMNYEPIEKRAGRVQQERQERLAKKKLDLELNDGDLTFRPAISASSERIAAQAMLRRGEVPRSGNVVQRLTGKGSDMRERRAQRQHARAQQDGEECRLFRARASANSTRLLRKKPHYRGGVDFVERQRLLEEDRKLRAQRRSAEVNDQSGTVTFQPKLLRNPERILVHSRPERLAETEQQRCERLSGKDTRRKEKLQASIREHYYAQYSYAPTINAVSEELVRDTHKAGQALYEDLHRNERGRHVRGVASSQVEEEALRDCTFRPKTLRRPSAQASEAIRSSRLAADDTIKVIERQRRSKEERLLQQRREQEYEELRECTFTPAILGPHETGLGGGQDQGPDSEGPNKVVVRGLGRFLELQQLAKQQDEEQKQREAKAFYTDTLGVRPEPYTVPEPFQLSENKPRNQGGKGENRKKKYRDECTFRPKTTAGAQRKHIERILAAD